LSQKAIQIGGGSGLTTEFIIGQASSHLAGQLEELFFLFDTFQEILYQSENPGGETEKAVYEESILQTLLGESFGELIDEGSGEWKGEREVLSKFYQVFDERIKAMFGGGAEEGERLA